jgi:hypothetical protein
MKKKVKNVMAARLNDGGNEINASSTILSDNTHEINENL